jgi:hypothetical protein
VAVANHALFSFPPDKSITNGKIRITELWVERGNNEWFAASCARFNSDWLQFHRFIKNSSSIEKPFSGEA